MLVAVIVVVAVIIVVAVIVVVAVMVAIVVVTVRTVDQKWRVVYLQLESELSEVKQKMREEKEQAEEKGEEVMARMHEVTQKLEDECSRSRTIIGALQEKLSEADKVSERLKKEEEEKTYSSSSEQSRISACPTAAEQMLKVLRLRPSPALHDNYELDQKWRVVYLQLESELSEVKQKMREEKEQAEEKGEEVMARMHEVTQKLEDECSRSRTIIGALQEKILEDETKALDLENKVALEKRKKEEEDVARQMQYDSLRGRVEDLLMEKEELNGMVENAKHLLREEGAKRERVEEKLINKQKETEAMKTELGIKCLEIREINNETNRLSNRLTQEEDLVGHLRALYKGQTEKRNCV
eukprot:GHVS01026650.1.p1 GENE.GHVS01026650.1~~GHVS01026650.1.p1  ORF type:complete len:355 (-),score=92.48 GHVS01026650.1:1178-2242(-)